MTPPASFYLARLERFARLRIDWDEDLSQDTRRALNGLIRLTVRDCREHGAGLEALAVLELLAQEAQG